MPVTHVTPSSAAPAEKQKSLPHVSVYTLDESSYSLPPVGIPPTAVSHTPFNGQGDRRCPMFIQCLHGQWGVFSYKARDIINRHN